MAVMEGMMNLFVKEVVSAERLTVAVRRLADVDANDVNASGDPEQGLLLWVTSACAALVKRVAAQCNVSLFPLFIPFVITVISPNVICGLLLIDF